MFNPPSDPTFGVSVLQEFPFNVLFRTEVFEWPGRELHCLAVVSNTSPRFLWCADYHSR